jgi:hypothetical protein
MPGCFFVPKTIACVWEMGSGLGHLTRLKPWVEHALKQDHRVALVVKELQNVHAVYDVNKIELLQAPCVTTPPSKLPLISWSEMLLLRYQSSALLANHLAAWRSIFSLINPDLVIYDSSPAALIASFGAPWLKWNVGSPFFMPRFDTPEFGVFPVAKREPAMLKRLKNSERQFLRLVQESFVLIGESRQISAVRELVAQADKELLTTLPQFDYFGSRSTGEYLGMPASIGGGAALPTWPVDSGIKIFAYLKRFPGMGSFLEALERSGVGAAIYSRDISSALKKKFSKNIYMDSPASMEAVCDDADLVIHMAGSQTVARCMKVGVAQLLIATALEQLFTAQSAQKLGAAFVVMGTASSYDIVIKQALLHAAKGRRPFKGARSEFLDGSYYEARASELIAEFC